MMDDALRDLYQEVIMDHNKNPRNKGALPSPDRQAEGQNPLCGDEVTVYLRLKDDRIEAVRFDGHGCAISQASASLMTQAVTGKTVPQAVRLFADFHRLVTREGEPDPAVLGKLSVFAGVGEFPARVKCASLAWHTLHAALKGERQPVTTE